jgi:hypothetical protein
MKAGITASEEEAFDCTICVRMYLLMKNLKSGQCEGEEDGGGFVCGSFWVTTTIFGAWDRGA